MLETKELSSLLVDPSVKIVVSDVDYTLVDFSPGHQAGIAALASTFGQNFGVGVDKIFHLILEGQRLSNHEQWNKRAYFDQVIAKIKELQKENLASYGLKPWSREAWMIFVSEKLGYRFTQNEVELGRDLYWQAVAGNLPAYPDALGFLELMEKRGIPVILMTAGDSVHVVREDLSLSYDPEFAISKKKARLSHLPFPFRSLVIGEPIDKPDTRFFNSVESEIVKYGQFDPFNILFIGDSFRNDLEVPEQRGFKTLLIKR